MMPLVLTGDGAVGPLSATEVGYLDGVTSGVQAQINGKLATPGAWTSWTPTWTNVTVGNGTVTSRYSKVGNLVSGVLIFTLGSTSSVSGDVSLTLPFSETQYVQGDAYLGDAGVGNYLATWIVSGGKLYFRRLNVSGTLLIEANLSSSTPFTWASGDLMRATFFYEAA